MNFPAIKVVRGTCPHDCPDTCAMLVTVENGRVTKVRGDPDHPTTQGVLCTKVSRYPERIYHPDRLTTPLKRIGRKGEGKFEPISWDEALDTITTRFKAIAADDPQGIMPFSFSGTLGLVQNFGLGRRFFNKLGASLPERVLCSTAGKLGYAIPIGATIGTDIVHFAESRLIILWGTNPITSNLHLWTRIAEAKRQGARVIVIDPYRSHTAEKADWHLAPLPGTDTALVFGIMQVLIAEDRLDHDYVDRYTLGFTELAQRVADYPPARVAAITGLAEADILTLAREYAGTRPAVIRTNFGLQRHAGGGNAVRAIACLPALVGAWRDPAGGVLLDNAGSHAIDDAALQRPDLLPSPPPRVINMAEIGKALTTLNDPPIRALYVFNSNPVAVAPNNTLVRQGFLRDDLLTVVHELMPTDTVDYADIVLPATSQVEQFDVHRPYGTLYSMINLPAIEPIGECKSNSEVFRLLAARMGFTDECLFESDETIGRNAFRYDAPVNAGLDFDQLKIDGWRRLDVPEAYAPFAEGNFPTPSGKCEFHSESAKAKGWDPLPELILPRESAARDPALAGRYPLAILTPPLRQFLNSSFSGIDSLVKDAGEPWVDIHELDAQARGITHGQRVRVFNDRGGFEVVARVGTRARPGVVVAPSIWWRKKSADGNNSNAVTGDGFADFGRGAAYYDALVEVAPVASPMPPGSAT